MLPAAPSGKNWGEIFFEGGTSLPPPLAACGRSGPFGKILVETNFGRKFCWRGRDPRPLPSFHPPVTPGGRAAVAVVPVSGKILRKIISLEQILGRKDPLGRLHPPSSSPWRPAAAVPPSGKFSKEQKCGGGYFFWRGDLPPPNPQPPASTP